MDDSRSTKDGSKTFLVVFAVFAATHLVDFVLYDQHLRSLAGAVGFALLAVGAAKHLSSASIAGAVLSIVALAAKYAS